MACLLSPAPRAQMLKLMFIIEQLRCHQHEAEGYDETFRAAARRPDLLHKSAGTGMSPKQANVQVKRTGQCSSHVLVTASLLGLGVVLASAIRDSVSEFCLFDQNRRDECSTAVRYCAEVWITVWLYRPS